MAELRFLSRLQPSGLMRLAEASEVAAVLRRGGLAVLPTETGYMLAARACDEKAVEQAFTIKGRDFSNPMHVACASLEMAAEFAHLSPEALKVIGALTPGPVTAVVPKKAVVPNREALPDRLVTLRGTVGIRVPDCAATLQVISVLGEPITATSLNESGQASVSIEPEELSKLAWPRDEIVYVVEGEGTVTEESASTLVLIDGSEVKVLRQGPVSKEEIASIAAS